MPPLYFYHFQVSNYLQWSDLRALVGAGLGAFLGFLAASQIYKKERRNKAEEERRLDQHLFDTARLLIENAAKGGRMAESSFRELLGEYEKEPYGLHKRHINLNTSLDTLDRMDRERLLRSYKLFMGEVEGPAQWRETWRFSAGLAAQIMLSEAVVLAGQQDLMSTAERFGALCQELLILGSYVVEEARLTPNTNPAVTELSLILDRNFNIGNVRVDVMHKEFLKPIKGLFQRRLLTIVNARQFAEVFAKAGSAFQRYDQLLDELKENLVAYALGCAAMAEVGERLHGRMIRPVVAADE